MQEPWGAVCFCCCKLLIPVLASRSRLQMAASVNWMSFSCHRAILLGDYVRPLIFGNSHIPHELRACGWLGIYEGPSKASSGPDFVST